MKTKIVVLIALACLVSDSVAINIRGQKVDENAAQELDDIMNKYDE